MRKHNSTKTLSLCVGWQSTYISHPQRHHTHNHFNLYARICCYAYFYVSVQHVQASSVARNCSVCVSVRALGTLQSPQNRLFCHPSSALFMFVTCARIRTRCITSVGWMSCAHVLRIVCKRLPPDKCFARSLALFLSLPVAHSHLQFWGRNTA